MENKQDKIKQLDKEIAELKEKKQKEQELRDKKKELQNLKYGDWVNAIQKVFLGIGNSLKQLWKGVNQVAEQQKKQQDTPKTKSKEKSKKGEEMPSISTNIDKLSKSTWGEENGNRT